MFYLRLFVTSLRSLDNHFLRSLLATVGVLIGVGSVVTSMSILGGATSQIMDNFKSLGSNLLYVHPTAAQISGRTVGVAQTLIPADVDTLIQELPDTINLAAPQATGKATIKRFEKSEDFTVVATSDIFFEIHSFNAASGRLFNHSESKDDAARVVCIGSKVAEKLFGGMDPVGQMIKIQNTSYRVLGVMEKRGNLGFMNADEAVFIPIKAGLSRFFNRKWLDSISVMAADPQKLDEAEKKIKKVLRQKHNIRSAEDDDFAIFNQQQAMESVNQATLIFKVVFYSIAGISLIVGGIGIMNIMLVSVTERTREIGVRMACGARRSDIMLQFLAEALIISLLGGGFGLILGWMMSDLLETVLSGMFNTLINYGVVCWALGISTSVGVISGLYPAYQASRKDPVEALRYE